MKNRSSTFPFSFRLPGYKAVANSPDESHAKSQGYGSDRVLWTPFCLRRKGMGVFLGIFVVLLVALTGLYIFSRKNQGLTTVNEEYYYLWKYGPTAVFLILTVFWKQVRYRVMQLAPWELMRQRPQAASDSVLLDYSSDWIVFAFFKSLRRRHFMVALATAGSILLSGANVFSTGIFSSHDRWYTVETTMQVVEGFNGSAFRRAYDTMHGSSRSALGYLAFDRYNLSKPIGIEGRYAFPVFQPVADDQKNGSQYEPGRQYQAEMDVFAMHIDRCEDAPLHVASPIGHWQTPHDVISPVHNCSSYSELGSGYSDDTQPFLLKLASGRDCGAGREYTLFVTIFRGEAGGIRADTIPVKEYREKVDTYAKAVACVPSYSINRGLVTLTSGDDGSIVNTHIGIDERAGKPFPGASVELLMKRLYYILEQVSINKIGIYKFIIPGGNGDEPWDPDSNALREGVVETIPQLAAWMVKYDLMKPANGRVNGTTTGIESRLVMQGLSFGLLAATLLLLASITIILSFVYLPLAACPRDPGSIVGIATIFARSTAFTANVTDLSLQSGSEMKDTLKTQTFGTTTTADGGFIITNGCTIALWTPATDDRHIAPSIVASTSSPWASSNPTGTTQSKWIPTSRPTTTSRPFRSRESATATSNLSTKLSLPTPPSPEKHDVTWWRPFSARIASRIVTLCTPAAVVGALEVLNQYSGKAHFIAIIDPAQLWYAEYLWTYLPALFMLGIRLLYHELEDTMRTFQSFNSLQKGSDVNSLFEHHKGQLSVVALWNAMRRQYWALVAASLAALLSFGLPIVVSGLYYKTSTSQRIALNVTQLDEVAVMPTTFPYYNREYIVPTVPAVILGEAEYPESTYRDLVFPRVEFSDSSRSGHYQYIDVRLPAVRLNMNCSALRREEYGLSVQRGSSWPYETAWIGRLTIPGLDKCMPGNFSEGVVLPDGSLADDWRPLDIYFSGERQLHPSYQEFEREFEPPHIGQNAIMTELGPSHCPTVVLYYGRVSLPIDSGVPTFENISVLQCRPQLEQVEVDVGLSLPSYKVRKEKPPSIVPGSTKVLWNAGYIVSNSTNGASNNWAPDGADVLASVSPTEGDLFYLNLGDFYGSKEEDAYLATSAIAAILNGYGYSSLLNPASYAAAITEVYGLVAAQMLHASTRVAYNTTAKRPVHSAIIQTNRAVLAQSPVSSRILEGLLAAMLLCGIAAMLFADTRKLLPKNPASIAGMASLLAGSDLASERVIPAGSEWQDDKTLKRRGIFDKYTFKLGWWTQVHSNGEVTERYGIDIEGAVRPGNMESFQNLIPATCTIPHPENHQLSRWRTDDLENAEG